MTSSCFGARREVLVPASSAVLIEGKLQPGIEGQLLGTVLQAAGTEEVSRCCRWCPDRPVIGLRDVSQDCLVHGYQWLGLRVVHGTRRVRGIGFEVGLESIHA